MRIHVPHVFAPKLIPPKYFYVLAPGMCEYRDYINTEGRGQSANTYSKRIPQQYFPVFALMRIQAPHAFAQKLIPQDFFPACIGFVPGGTGLEQLNFKVWNLAFPYTTNPCATFSPLSLGVGVHQALCVSSESCDPLLCPSLCGDPACPPSNWRPGWEFRPETKQSRVFLYLWFAKPGRLIFYHFWCWRARGAAPVKPSTGSHFPRKYPRIPRNHYQYWC